MLSWLMAETVELENLGSLFFTMTLVCALSPISSTANGDNINIDLRALLYDFF